jgi:hypothetical protein
MTVHKESAELAPPRGDPRADDRRDWIAIGVIVAASSLLLWVPFLV